MPRPEVAHIALTFADGTLGGMQFVTAIFSTSGDVVASRAPTAEAVEEEIAKLETGLPAEKWPVRSWRFCAAEDFPVDRTYRDAWRDTGTEIIHDMAHAREIHREHLRRDRAPILAALDVEYLRALEGTAKRTPGEVVSEKRRLRDITKHPAIDAAQTVEELKAVRLEESV